MGELANIYLEEQLSTSKLVYVALDNFLVDIRPGFFADYDDVLKSLPAKRLKAGEAAQSANAAPPAPVANSGESIARSALIAAQNLARAARDDYEHACDELRKRAGEFATELDDLRTALLRSLFVRATLPRRSTESYAPQPDLPFFSPLYDEIVKALKRLKPLGAIDASSDASFAQFLTRAAEQGSLGRDTRLKVAEWEQTLLARVKEILYGAAGALHPPDYDLIQREADFFGGLDIQLPSAPNPFDLGPGSGDTLPTPDSPAAPRASAGAPNPLYSLFAGPGARATRPPVRRFRADDLSNAVPIDLSHRDRAVARREIADRFAQFSESVRNDLGSALDDLARKEFDVFSESMSRSIATGHLAVGGFGKVAKEMAVSTIKSIGAQSAVQGGHELAEGFKALGDNTGDAAGAHFAAAGKFFALAALAGVGGGALSAGSGSKDGAASPKSGSGSGKNRVIQKITIIGSPGPEHVAATKSQLKKLAH